ncbi:Hypothetical predicted protein [Podarcis lilfordi]|uniref:Uncharacterized protein n=1 Tax=Podarcis lilfordi TaxID=74358 RepID=A0AA35PPF1_9SAUR|nr:Hypothetical predicted protein [Podarcis lilfordi]
MSEIREFLRPKTAFLIQKSAVGSQLAEVLQPQQQLCLHSSSGGKTALHGAGLKNAEQRCTTLGAQQQLLMGRLVFRSERSSSVDTESIPDAVQKSPTRRPTAALSKVVYGCKHVLDVPSQFTLEQNGQNQDLMCFAMQIHTKQKKLPIAKNDHPDPYQQHFPQNF